MSKLIIEPIQVHINGGYTKMSFIWRKRLYRVEDILSWWREPSEWWNGEPMRCFLRVNARNSSVGTYELFKDGKNWFLYRVLD
jgi:hypothetical protein